MLTPDYLMNVAEPMVELWSQLEVDITQDIARRLVKNNGFFTETAKWQALKAREMGMLQDDIAVMVKKYSKQSKAVVKSLVHEACALSLKNDDAYYTKAGLKPESLAASKALQEVIAAGVVKTNGVMRNFTNTTAKTATKAFENALDRAYMQVLSGAFSYEQALHTAVRDLALKGIEKIAYPSGRVDRADVAARRALVTGLNQTTAQLQLSRAAEMECYLVEVTSHAGARPSHAEWQGQIFWHGQKVKGYENLEDVTGYGTGDGLCGWNCYHSFFPYFEGLSRPAFERDPSARLGKSNDQMYEEQQHQRYLERRVRDAKREAGAYQMAAKEAKQQQTQAAFEQAYREAHARLQKRQAALVDYCEQTGRTLLPERTRVALVTKKQKATHKAQLTKAAKKALVKVPASHADIMARARRFASQDEAITYHLANNFDRDFFMNALTQQERQGVIDYTSYHYKAMNKDLRAGVYSTSTKRPIIDACTSALQKATVKEDVWLTRGMGYIDALSDWTGISVPDLATQQVQKRLIGTRLTERAFMSCGTHDDSAWDGIKLEICVPAGTHGMYVDPISANQGEYELLLQRNSTFEVKEVKADGRGHIKTLVLMLVEQKLP